MEQSETVEALDDWFPALRWTAEEIWKRNADGTYPEWDLARDLSNRTLLQRIYSTHELFENMVELWSNHLHVEARHFPAFTQRAKYDEAIREHALGRFSDLLVAATLHPAMLMYLNNYRSNRVHPNENHGRELLELHTVGAGAGYTEQMVRDSGKILSGHTVAAHWDGQMTFRYFYDPNRHATGAVAVLGFQNANATASNSGLAEEYLRYLAAHPATAERIARKLCVRFVSDTPSPQLIASVAAAYLRSNTDIKSTLRAMVASAEFQGSGGLKFRTPADDVVATCRALGVQAMSPTSPSSFAHSLSWVLNSSLLFQWPRPDGMPDQASAWASTTRLLNSWRMHWNLGAGWYPTGDAVFRSPASWLPTEHMRFDAFFDHLSRSILGLPATTTLLRAAEVAVGVNAAEVITSGHVLLRWHFPPLLAVLLDSPHHAHR